MSLAYDPKTKKKNGRNTGKSIRPSKLMSGIFQNLNITFLICFHIRQEWVCMQDIRRVILQPILQQE